MDLVVPVELEELILCSCCHLPFNDTDALPKLFTCRHHFCLKCVNSILLKSGELYCVHCWKRTELPAPDMKPESLPTHNAILYLAQNLSMLNMKPKAPDKSPTSGGSGGGGGGGGGSGGGGSNSVVGGNGGNGCGMSGNNNNNNNGGNGNNNGNNGGGGGGGIGGGNGNNNNNNNLSTSNQSIQMHKMKKGENCHTHAMPNALWCLKCHTMICRACAGAEEHRSHTVKPQNEAKDTIRGDIANELLTMQKTLVEVQHLVLKQRDFLLKILEACTALKTQIETELINHLPTLEIAEMRESLGKAKICLGMLEQQTPTEAYKLYSTLHLEKQRLQSKFQEMYLQCKLDDLIRHCGSLFDFELIKQALVGLQSGDTTITAITMNGIGHHNQVLLLANYCISQLYSRHILTNKHSHQLTNNGNGGGGGGGSGQHQIQHQQQQQQQQQHQLHQQQQHHHQQQQQQQQHHQQQPYSPVSSNQLLSVSHEPKTFAEIAGSPKGMSHNNNNNNNNINNNNNNIINNNNNTNINNNNYLLDSNHPPPSSSGGGRHSSASYMSSGSSELNGSVGGGGVTITMMQHLQQHSNQQQQQQQQQQMSVGGGSTILQQSPVQQQQQQSATNQILCNPTVHVYPIYYFNIEINGAPCGRILIEVRNDVAPKMAKNFGALSTGELGFGYKGCQIFQCWENESIITGDFELNNGRGGRSVFEEGFFMPDDTKILAIRGSVGMRRSQKRHDNMGLVGSQFRIILREMRGFTGIFAFVVEGLELVEKISHAGDSAGKPQSNVLIVSCGKLQ